MSTETDDKGEGQQLPADEEVVVFRKDAPQTSRLTAITQLSYQSPEFRPETIPLRFSRTIESQEQSYHRLVWIGVEWVTLDTGWVTSQPYVVIENRSKSARLFVSNNTSSPPMFYVPPGEFFNAQVTNPRFLRIRSTEERTKVAITAFPSK